MKTKISHLGRSSVSVILAVMMLLSTMLIGTMSVVDAATEYYYRGSDNNWGATAMTKSTDGKYFYFQSSNNTNQFKISTSADTLDYNYTYVQKGFNNTDVQNIGHYSSNNCYVWQSGTYYILVYVPGTDINTTNNPIICASTTLPQATAPVAESVKLTASHETVTSGGSTTLTATLTGKAVSNVTLTLTGGGTTQTETVTGSDTTATFTVSPTSTTTYTVTASAENYSSKSATTTINVVGSDTYYLWTSALDDVTNPSAWTSTELTYSNGSYVGNVIFPKNGQNYFFTINKSPNSVRESSIWSSKNEVRENLSSTETSGFTSAIDVQENNGVFLARLSFQKVNTDVKFTFTPEKTVVISRNTSTPVGNVTIKVPTVENAKVTAVANNSTTYNEGESFDIEVGSSFTVNVTGEKGYTLNTITYGKQSKTETGANFTAESGAKTFSVVMNPPVSEPVTVTFGSNNGKYGTVSAKHNEDAFTSGEKVKVGDTVTFTAKPESGYALSDWTVTVNGTSETRTEPSLSLEITANTIVTANFKVEDSGTPSGYYILWGTDASFTKYKAKQLYSTDDGKYYASFNVATDNIDIMKKDCFFVFSTSNTTSGVTPKETKVIVNQDTQNKFYFESSNSNISGVGSSIIVPKIWNENDDLIGFKIIVSDINGKVTYSCEPTFDVAPADTVEITAKDGTIRGTTATIADLGNTTIEVTTPEGKTLKATDSFSNKAQTVKKVPDKSKVKVTTTIDKSKTFAGVSGSGYYVKGFSINGIFGGVLSQSEGKSHGSDVYTFEFTVNQELYNETKLEITPVYFLKDDSNCVYFYIENYDSAKQIWGNTPSCYVYYGSGTTTLEALGYYPGQPMVDYNGSIFTQIPKYIDNGGTQVDITGMTLNNYVWDDVHSAYNGKNQREDNAQTYDYDDFVKIADSGVNAENIIYRFKYNEHNNVPGATLDTSDTDADGWEVFLDYQNYPTDIFGTRIGDEKLDYKDTNSVTSKDNCLSIISDGYQTNYIGQYATAWSIYKKTGEKVATIPSSALLYALDKTEKQMTDAIELGTTPGDFLPGKEDRDTYWETFKTLYEKYKGFYAQINFEAAIKQGPDVGNRLDGRWYYTKSSQDITGEIKIQYANTLDDYNKVGGFNEDTFETDSSIIGKTTGASAYFTDPENKVRKLNTTADNTRDYKFEVTATPSTAAYTFVGWYRLIDGDYKAINPSNMNSLTGAVTRNSDVTLVARYIKTPGGSMTFQHSLYKGENAGGGKATTEIQVVVKNSEGELLYDSHKIPGTASIDKTKITELAKQQDLTVTVTLYTTTKNLYDFKGYYSAENTPVTKPFTDGFTKEVTGTRKEGLVTTSEYTFSFDKYYQKYASTLTAPDAGTVYYNFYSDITSIKVPYKVQFSYEDREGNQKYYNRAGYVDPENTSSYTFVEYGNDVKVTLTDSFILSLAPYESNFTKNLTWDKTPVSNTAFDSSNNKSIASAVVNSTQSYKKIHLSVYLDGNSNPTPLINKAGHFEFFTKDGSFEFPYGSVFYTKNDDGTYTYDITADKTYTDESGNELKFMYWEIYSDPECKNLVIKAYNSEGHFSYVAYDNCWIVPVYGKSSTPVASVKEVSTSTQFMEVTRNQWTAENAESFTTGFDVDTLTTLNDFNKEKGEDKLYADFVLNFFYNGKQLSVFDPNSLKVQAGVLIQRLALDENKTGPGYITDLDYYANKKFTPEQLDDAKKDAIQKITTGNSAITSVKQKINNSRLDNKNRLQYYTRFNNVVDNSDYVFRLYTYIQYTDANGKQVVELSDPVYFTFYDIANKS